MKFATTPVWYCPSHHRHVVALLWEIKTSYFLQMWKKTQTNCILIAANFVIHPHLLIFSVFKTASLSLYRFQIKLSVSLFFYLFTYVINFCHWKFVTADVTAVFSTIKMVFSDKDKILMKSLYLKGYTAKWLTDEFAGQSMVLISCWKSCETRAQLTGSQAAADRAVPALKKRLRPLMT